MYRFKIKNLNINAIDGMLKLKPKKINVIIGPNNSGKSRMLKELRDFLSGDMRDIKMIETIDYDYPPDLTTLDENYDIKNRMTKDFYGNWILRTYSNKSDQLWDLNATFENYFTRNLNSIGGNWSAFFEDIIKNKEENQFFQYLGSLFFQYLGTEERLTICKMQKNYGLDSNNTNYLTSFKFEEKLLNELADNVKRIFKKDIVLDNQTLGDRLVFRVGKNFDYLTGILGNDSGEIRNLFNEDMLDNLGDGLKSYVSTFLSLKAKGNDVLLIDEPEAFLHPPLARQIGELIGEFKDEKQVFISTHSVEVLKGILSKSSDVNVIRITQPETYKNKINVLDKDVLQNIMQSPLLRVSRILEGLFCEKVVITEAEADELIYQELIEKVFPQSGLYFAHGQNKQTLAEIAELYQKIGINYEVITDFDVLRVNEEFNKFMNMMDLDEDEKQNYRRYIGELRNQIDREVVTEGLDEEKKKEVLKKQRDKVYHQMGLEYLSDGDLRENIKNLLDTMKKNHVHILRTGELETLFLPFEVEYTHNKSRWIVNAINKITELKKENIEAQEILYDFLVGIIIV